MTPINIIFSIGVLISIGVIGIWSYHIGLKRGHKKGLQDFSDILVDGKAEIYVDKRSGKKEIYYSTEGGIYTSDTIEQII